MPPDPKLISQGGGSVWLDENPACPPERCYKSWRKIYPKPGTGIKGPHRVYISPDGLHWRFSPKLVTGLRTADTQSTWFWDTCLGRYLGFSREWVGFAAGHPIRMASCNESDDMHTCRNMKIVLAPDEIDYSAAPRPLVDPPRMKIMRETWVPLEAVTEVKEKPASADPDHRLAALRVPVFHRAMARLPNRITKPSETIPAAMPAPPPLSNSRREIIGRAASPSQPA